MYTPYLEAIDENSVSIDRDGKVKGEIKPVSYTHLTLPTKA